MRAGIFNLSTWDLEAFLGLPGGSIKRVDWSMEQNALQVMFIDDRLPEVAEGCLIPMVNMTCKGRMVRYLELSHADQD